MKKNLLISINIITFFLVIGVSCFMVNIKLKNITLNEEIKYLERVVETQKNNIKILKLELVLITKPTYLKKLYTLATKNNVVINRIPKKILSLKQFHSLYYNRYYVKNSTMK